MKMRLPLASLLTITIFYVWFYFTDAIECEVGNGMLIVGNGAGQFATVQASIDAVPSGNDQWIRITVNPGTYNEQVQIPPEKPCIFLEGSDKRTTVITYDAHAQTDTSATFSSFADNIVARGITFMNSYDRLRGYEPSITQAVAARIYGDKCIFFDCGFVGLQDTVFDATGRHYFRSCYVEGAIDFIFGDAQSFYENCYLNVTVGWPPYYLSKGYVTAQGRQSANDPGGFVFERGALVSGKGRIFLGRAYGPYSRVIFHRTTMSSFVAPEGWDAWSHTGHEGNFTYAEAECTGPGADTSKRVKWEKQLDASQLQQYSRSSFIDKEGWLAGTPLGRM